MQHVFYCKTPIRRATQDTSRFVNSKACFRLNSCEALRAALRPSQVRGHLVLAVVGVSSLAPSRSLSHTHAHTLCGCPSLLQSVWRCLSLYAATPYFLSLSVFLSLSHTHTQTHNQQAVSILSAGEVRWREWVRQKGWEEINSSWRGEEERRQEGTWGWSACTCGCFSMCLCVQG